jgi:hypothetical protein
VRVLRAGGPGQEALQCRAGRRFPAVAAACVEVGGEPGWDVEAGHPGGRGESPDDGGVPGGQRRGRRHCPAAPDVTAPTTARTPPAAIPPGRRAASPAPPSAARSPPAAACSPHAARRPASSAPGSPPARQPARPAIPQHPPNPTTPAAAVTQHSRHAYQPQITHPAPACRSPCSRMPTPRHTISDSYSIGPPRAAGDHAPILMLLP